MTCTGAPTEYCGGPNRLSTYRKNSTLGASGSASPTAPASATPTPTGPITVRNITGYTYLGCYSEATAGRALSGLANPIPGNTVTPNTCARACGAFQYFGVEYSGECYCGNSINTGSALVAGNTPAVTQCDMTCSGNNTEYCGGPNRLNMFQKVYNLTTSVPPTTVKQVGTFLSQGCYKEATNGRLLSGASYANNTAMTVESCVNFCQASGATYAGLEYAQECFCGSSLASTAVTADASSCNMLCTGNSTEFCGSTSILNVYKNTPSSVSSAGTP